MGPWPKRHEEQGEREREREASTMEMGEEEQRTGKRGARYMRADRRGEGGRPKEEEEKKKNNMKDEGEDEREAGTRIENKREGEGDGSGCQGWGRERSFHSLFFHFVPRQTPGAAVTFPTHSLLSCQYVLQKYNSGGWKKTDCGLFFFFFFWGASARLCLHGEVRNPPRPICHFVSGGWRGGSSVRTVNLRRGRRGLGERTRICVRKWVSVMWLRWEIPSMRLFQHLTWTLTTVAVALHSLCHS